jgi:hypothetical protein
VGDSQCGTSTPAPPTQGKASAFYQLIKARAAPFLTHPWIASCPRLLPPDHLSASDRAPFDCERSLAL